MKAVNKFMMFLQLLITISALCVYLQIDLTETNQWFRHSHTTTLSKTDNCKDIKANLLNFIFSNLVDRKSKSSVGQI